MHIVLTSTLDGGGTIILKFTRQLNERTHSSSVERKLYEVHNHLWKIMLSTLQTSKESWKWYRTASFFIITAGVLGSWFALLFFLWSLGPGLWSTWFSFLIITRWIRRWTWTTWLRRSPSWMLKDKILQEKLTLLKQPYVCTHVCMYMFLYFI